MSTEFEAKFLDIDVEIMQQKLRDIGASRIHEKNYVEA